MHLAHTLCDLNKNVSRPGFRYPTTFYRLALLLKLLSRYLLCNLLRRIKAVFEQVTSCLGYFAYNVGYIVDGEMIDKLDNMFALVQHGH